MKYLTLIIALLISANAHADAEDYCEYLEEQITKHHEKIIQLEDSIAYLSKLGSQQRSDGKDEKADRNWSAVESGYENVEREKAYITLLAEQWSLLSCAKILY